MRAAGTGAANTASASRELVTRTLDFEAPHRVPRQLWTLPWAVERYSREISSIRESYPEDLVVAPEALLKQPRVVGNRYEPGEHVDAWGCRFTTIERGLAGEVKHPLIAGRDWEELDRVRAPVELLGVDTETVNAFCRNTDQFVLAPSFIGPFERLQYLRGTEELLVDIGLRSAGVETALAKVHEFLCRYVDVWTRTAVDAVWMMEDWGAQRGMLIDPSVWAELFRPLYREYAAIAHANRKRFFMHSDGHILAILRDLIDTGVDALNAQIGCMGVESLREFRGSITFWGEIDRQWLLPYGSEGDVRDAVAAIREALWDRGGCIAQCEFGVGARPENVRAVYRSWDEMGA